MAHEYYGNQKVFEGSVELEKMTGLELDPQMHGAEGVPEDENLCLKTVNNTKEKTSNSFS